MNDAPVFCTLDVDVLVAAERAKAIPPSQRRLAARFVGDGLDTYAGILVVEDVDAPRLRTPQ
jgi:hypothetical protein